MIKAELGAKGTVTWHRLYADGHYIASIWGKAEVEALSEKPGYHVTIEDRGVIGGFFHCDEVEYKAEKAKEPTRCGG